MYLRKIWLAYSRLSTGMKVAVGAGLVAIVFVVDCLTGSEISFSIFYLLPIALVAATAGWNGAIFISIISGVSWYSADYVGGAHYSAAWIPIWNALMRTMIFMLVARLVISLITARNKATKAEAAAHKAAKAKGDFLSNMSHEIRTPLNAMMGVAQLLGETNLDARQRELTRIFRTEGEQLRRLINDVLDLSKVEAGKFQLEIKPFHLGKMAQALVQTFNPAATEKSLQLEAVVAPAVDSVWIGDDQRLRQVLANLISNALKFTLKGGIILRIEAETSDTGSPVLKFSVEDTGIGIDPEDQGQLFQRYEQLENSATNLTAGTGLGLSISRAIVESMGGSLQLKSEPGRGSTFYFSLSLAPASLPAQSEKIILTNGKVGEGLQGKSILVVEDYKTNQLIFAEYLTAAGCRVALAANGREGVQAFLTGSFDAVIMDMQMPVLDGWSATREIRLWEKENKRTATPIIALTASALKEDQERCREAGCTLFLAKPVLKHELLKAMASLIDLATNEPPPAESDTSVKGLLPMFFAETTEAAAEIRLALAAKDWAKISAKGHQLTGSGSTFGYPIITNFGREIETAAAKRDESGVREQVDALAKLLSTLHPK